MLLGPWRAFMPLYIEQCRELDRCYRCLTHWLTHWQTLKDSATQLLIKYKSGALVTQCPVYHRVKSMFVWSARHWQGTRQTGTINRLYNHDLRAWAQTPAAAPSDQGGPEFSGFYLEQSSAYFRGAKDLLKNWTFFMFTSKFLCYGTIQDFWSKTWYSFREKKISNRQNYFFHF